MKTKTIHQIGFKITGVADLTLWGGGNACIEMKPFRTNTDDPEEIKKGINDNGFGVQTINGAICDIWELYYYGCTEFLKTITIGEVSENTNDYYINE